MQYLDTGYFLILLTATVAFFILFNVFRARKASGEGLYIRRIAGLNAIDEAVGRATEMGRPVVMVPGLSDTINAKSLQALNIFAHVSRTAARFANPILVCCYNATIYATATEMIRDSYQQEGAIDKFDPDSVRFISDRQFAFAAGVSGLVLREKAAAAFFMGEFYAESLIFAETANSIGAIQVASSTEITQTPFFVAACDYVLIGDEFYAAGAYLTKQPVLVGSLIGQDWSKVAIAALIFLGVLGNSIEMAFNYVGTEFKGGELMPVTVPRHPNNKETFFGRLFTPNVLKDDIKKMDIKYEELPKAEQPKSLTPEEAQQLSGLGGSK